MASYLTLVVAVIPILVCFHDPSTASRKELTDRVQALIAEVNLPGTLSSLASVSSDAVQLRRALATNSAVREMIHLRVIAAPIVLGSLQSTRIAGESRRGQSNVPTTEEEVGVCIDAYILEQSDFRGAIPTLAHILEGARGDEFMLNAVTQAAKALSRQTDQAPLNPIFSTAQRAQAASSSLEYARARQAELLSDINAPSFGATVVGASGVRTLREMVQQNEKAIELAYLTELGSDPLIAFLNQDLDHLRGHDVALCTVSYALEMTHREEAVATLAHFVSLHANDFVFAPHFATRALIVLTNQTDPQPLESTYGEEEQARAVETALNYLSKKK